MDSRDLTPALRELLAPLVEDLVSQTLARLSAEGRIQILDADVSTADLDARFGMAQAVPPMMRKGKTQK